MSIYIGAAYYPELWSEDEIDRDVGRLHAAGVNCVRIGEFAWSTMEPEEGKFDLSLFERVVDRMHAAGIATVMCTPTCTPPRWLYERYPETRKTDADGLRNTIFGRHHPCRRNPVFREKSRIIVEKMGEALGRRAGVIGWQIDNELYPYCEGCYCPRCIGEFRARLKAQYGDIRALNEAWGMKRWSLEFGSFDEIVPPHPTRGWIHPTLRIAWHRYQNDLLTEFAAEQAEILRRYTDAPVGTDMIRGLLSYTEVNRALDVVQYNHYETQEKIAEAGFAFDHLRTVKPRPFWVTETQPGWDGGVAATKPLDPGACYANTVHPFVKGAEMNSYWLFRAHAAGHELVHGALYGTSGRETAVVRTVRRAAEDLAKCADFLERSKIVSRVALHVSNTAMTALRAEPITDGLDPMDVLSRLHGGFRKINLDVIETDSPLDGYEVVITPFVTTLTDHGLDSRVLDWVKRGGTWIVGPLTDYLDANGVKYTDSPHPILERVTGVAFHYEYPFREADFGAVWEDGSPCGLSWFYEALEPCGARTLARYTKGDFAGYAAVTETDYGKGRIVLCGGLLTAEEMLRVAGIAPIAAASEKVTLAERSGERAGIVALELYGEDGWIDLPAPHRELIGGGIVSGRVPVPAYSLKVFEKLK